MVDDVDESDLVMISLFNPLDRWRKWCEDWHEPFPGPESIGCEGVRR